MKELLDAFWRAAADCLHTRVIMLSLVPLPLLLVSVWLYTLVFAFAALWFAHFALAALQRLRLQQGAAAAMPPPAVAAPPRLPPAL